MLLGHNYRQLLAATLVLSLSGCAALVAKCDRKHPPPPALVTTGGPFALERTLAIPATGLTLGGVVDEALRSGWSASRTSGSVTTHRPAGRRSAQPVTEQALTPNEHFNNAINAVAEMPAHETVLIESRRLYNNLFPNEEIPPAQLEQLVADFNPILFMPVTNDVQGRKDALEERKECLEEMGRLDDESRKNIASDIQLLEAKINSIIAERTRIMEKVKTDLQRHIAEYLLAALTVTDRPTDTALQIVANRISRLQAASNDLRGQQQIATALIARFTEARERGQLNQPNLEARRAILYQIAFGADPSTVATAQPASAMGGGPASAPAIAANKDATIAADDLVVVLTRRTGRSLVFPLDLVQRSSAGDVWLGHGDRITITSFRRTDLSQTPNDDGDEAIVLTSLTTEAIAQSAGQARFVGFSQLVDSNVDATRYADIVIVRRVNARDGIDEYFLPVPKSPLDPGYAFAETCLNEAIVQAGDHVHFDILENTSIVRESRDRARRVAEQRFTPDQKISLLDQLDPLGLLVPLRSRQSDLARGLNQQFGGNGFVDPSARLSPRRPPLQ